MIIGQFFLLLNLAFLLSFYTILPKLMKIFWYFLSHRANSIKKSLFKGYLTPVTLTFDHFSLNIKLCLPFIILHQSSYKLVNNFLSYRGNSLEIVIFYDYLTPVTFTCNLQLDHFSDYQTYLSFYHYTPSCQRSSKSVNNVLSCWGNSLKTVIFNVFLTPVSLTCDLDHWPIFPTIALSFQKFYHSTLSCQRPSKSVHNFLSYWGNSLKNSHFLMVFWPLWPWPLIECSNYRT